MRRHQTNYALAILGWLQWIVGLATAMVGAALKASAADFSSGIAHLIQFSHRNAWWFVPAATLFLALSHLIRSSLGSPWVGAVIHSILTDFRNQVFQDKHGPQHYNRATLFKYVRWRLTLRRWPFGGWLKSVERSGHTSRKRIAAFRAPDDADKVEGVAGMTWACNEMVVVTDLPDLVDLSDQAVARYSRDSWLPEDLVRNRRPASRSLCGLPIQANGRVWGVLVLDSRSPRGFPKKIPSYYRLVAQICGKLLEGD